MVSYCANPECGAEFLYLHEGEIFILELPDRSVQRYWLCKSCAPRLHLVYDRSEGVKIVSRSGIRQVTRAIVRAVIKKPPGSEKIYKGSSPQVFGG